MRAVTSSRLASQRDHVHVLRLSARRHVKVNIGCSAEGESHQPLSSGLPPRAPQRRKSLQEALSTTLSEISKLDGRTTDQKNYLLVDGDEDQWRRLDSQVNQYPRAAEFTAIGHGGESFRLAMVSAVEQVVGQLHCECVTQRASSSGSYISVRLSCHVQSADEVVRIYENMRSDSRLRFFI